MGKLLPDFRSASHSLNQVNEDVFTDNTLSITALAAASSSART